MELADLKNYFTPLSDEINLRILHEVSKHFEIDIANLSLNLKIEEQELSANLRQLVETGLLSVDNSGSSPVYNVRISIILEMKDFLAQISEGWGNSFWEYAKPEN